MYYLSIINDLQMGNKTINASKIFKVLFDNDIWLFTKKAPFMKKINEKDRFILYLAGDQRRFFQSVFIINSQIKKIQDSNIDKKIDKEILKFFYYYVHIKDISHFENKVKIKDIKRNLEFITDKTNYGLFLRQSVKKINEKDFNYILKQQT